MTRVAVPSTGRLRDVAVSLLAQAGLSAPGLHRGARVSLEGLELIEMRPRDAAAWLRSERLGAAFLSTDLVAEEELSELPALALGAARSQLVVANRSDDPRSRVDHLAGAIVATHLPVLTRRFFADHGVEVAVVAMGGSLEGVCAAGLADAIVDLTETGDSLHRNGLRALAVLADCQALLVYNPTAHVGDLVLRCSAVLEARGQRYVMFHLAPTRLEQLAALFPGLAAPTVLPLAGRDDLCAVHLVLSADEFWARLGELRSLGATGIVAISPEALVR